MDLTTFGKLIINSNISLLYKNRKAMIISKEKYQKSVKFIPIS
jgi:hypothetical protein